MEAWILILVMINPTTPHIITIPVEEFPTKVSCMAELYSLTEAANADDVNGQATLICLRDVRTGDNDNSFTPENLNTVRIAVN